MSGPAIIHPAYGTGDPALIGDTVADTTGNVLGAVWWITSDTVWVDVAGEEQLVPYPPTGLVLIQRGQP